ncbi:hypothetical protein [Neptuniibacter halophilus]|uniref:hypothetical protein n=1 Tax=Neptuniibacter halophilus TaxID=651666 RepID=UPI002573E457|nr:hypothetical protein [Neptuniibacter halophilus]
MEKLQASDSTATYSLFYLDQHPSGSVEWKKASRDSHYFSDSRMEIQRILHQLKLPLGDFGYSQLSEITNISKASIQNMLRQPEDPRFQSISQQGMLYIKYRVQEALKQRGIQND